MLDLANGKQPALFKPVRHVAGSPGKGCMHDHLKGVAARALSELIAGRVPKEIAAGRIAGALKGSRKDMADITADTS
jgi:hypothetical protein